MGQSTKRSIILSEIIIETFPVVKSLQSDNKFFLKRDMLMDSTHPLLSGIPPEIMYQFQIIRRIR